MQNSFVTPTEYIQTPHSIEAEKLVLGAILFNDELLAGVSEIVAAADFYHPAHSLIFKLYLQITAELKKIDTITLKDALQKEQALEKVGGVAYLVSLQEDISSLSMVHQHAQMIREKAILRSLINSAMSIISRCQSQNTHEIDSVLDEAEKTIFEICNKRVTKGFSQLDIWLKKTFQHLSAIKSMNKGITGIASDYKKLDGMTSGFQKGDLIVLAARPSMGKTALALSFAHNAAAAGLKVGLFSLEMAAEQLTLRLLSMQSGIAHHRIRNADISSDEWCTITSIAAHLASLKLYIDDTATVSIMELRAKARKLKLEHGLDLLVIDYLQLLHSTKRHENRHQEVSEISRSLKALAKELEIPVIALSQLSRAVDSRMDKRPMLSDLRESGAIEQDADLIGFLYREIVYNAEAENPALAELIIGKQRNGPTGTVFLHFEREVTKFHDMEE